MIKNSASINKYNCSFGFVPFPDERLCVFVQFWNILRHVLSGVHISLVLPCLWNTSLTCIFLGLFSSCSLCCLHDITSSALTMHCVLPAVPDLQISLWGQSFPVPLLLSWNAAPSSHTAWPCYCVLFCPHPRHLLNMLKVLQCSGNPFGCCSLPFPWMPASLPFTSWAL